MLQYSLSINTHLIMMVPLSFMLLPYARRSLAAPGGCLNDGGAYASSCRLAPLVAITFWYHAKESLRLRANVPRPPSSTST